MVKFVNYDACVGCGECVDACPTKVLKVVDDMITIDQPDLCLSCGACVSVCFMNVLEV